jgi:peptidoglycan/LPS O-acetylase OafA/YrhL
VAIRARRTSFGYKPSLDGLRAVAVGAVIAYHFFPRFAPAGYLGVDVFFVLSGYLITSLLLVEWKGTGTIDLRAFWARRARRLLPALFLVLLAFAVWSALALQPMERGRIRGEGLATLFYGANWYFIHGGQPYFDRIGISPLEHAWSLAVEEQFYLAWPLVVLGCLSVTLGRMRSALVPVTVLGVGVSVLLMALLYVPGDIYRSYMATDTRAHQLLIGALLAVGLRSNRARHRVNRVTPWALGPAAVVMCAAAMIFAPGLDQSFLYQGGSVLFAVAVATVIAAAVAPGRSPIKGVLSLPPLVWLGRISYGLYLWHFPVLMAISESRTGLDGPALTLVHLSGTLLLATLSFYLVEQPIRRGALGARQERFATAMAIAGVASALIIASAGARVPV